MSHESLNTDQKAQPDQQAGPAASQASAMAQVPTQWPGEPAEGYNAFLHYYRLGATTTQKKIGAMIGKSEKRISDWKNRWRWEARIAEHLKPASNLPDHSDQWAEKHADIRKIEWELHLDTVRAAKEALARWHESDKVPNLSEIVKLIELASRLARLAAGLPLSHTEITGADGGAIRIEFEGALERAYGKSRPVSAEIIDVPATPETRTTPENV